MPNARSIAVRRDLKPSEQEPRVPDPPSGGDPRAIHGLVQHLVGAVVVGPDGAADNVLLDVEVDGVRCLLVRQPRASDTAEVSLSPREQEIARMVAKGYPNKVIARVLEISAWTVSSNLRRIFTKLGVSSRAAMVAQLAEERQLGEARRLR